MGKTENLVQQDAVEKIRQLAMEVDIAMLCTNLGAKPFNTCPMSTQAVDDDGTIWFFSNKDSDHNLDLVTDADCQLIYSSKVGETNHLSLYGTAEITFDRAKAEKLWSPIHKTWFPGGLEDPKLSMIRFVPRQGYYWDSKHGKMVSFAKMAFSALTGKSVETGVTGTLRI